MLAGRLRRQALVVIQFQRLQQRMFRVAPHESPVCLGIEMAVFFDKGVVL